MMGSQSNSINPLLSELVKFGASEEYERALKTANKVLQQQPNEENALGYKIICLIHLSRFQDALQVLKQAPKQISEKLLFEKAYCQYKQGAVQEALKTVSLADDNLKIKELKAQILYRLERYEECYDAYQEILKNSDDVYQDERKTNLSAVIANLTIEGSKKQVAPIDESTYERVYNAACKLIGLGQYNEAEKKLRLAEKMCREALSEDDASEEDIEKEISIIRVQLGFVTQTLGREKESLEIYNSILKEKPDDPALVAIACNNVVVLNRERDQNVFDSKKKIKSATSENLDQKLTTRQRKDIALNNCLFALYTNQVEFCNQLCSKLTEKFPDTARHVIIIKALLQAKSGKGKQAHKILSDYIESHPEYQFELGLADVQLLLEEGDIATATQILENLGDNSFKPGIVSALVTLYLAQNDWKTASKTLEKAVDWYRKNKVSNDNLEALWKQAADFHMRQGEPDVAAKSMEELLKIYPDDKQLQAKLLIAYAQFDQNKAESLSKKLSLGSKGTDVDALEALSWIMGTKVIKKASKVDQTPKSTNSELIEKKKKRKKKPGKLPKNYDPSVPPNPERWLPRHERSGYRKNKRERDRDRRNKDAQIGKGTQGDAANAADQFDITKMSSQAKQSVVPNSPRPAVVEVEGPRRKPHQMKKKKRK
nr:PREDICTED: signal recognition particle subunit SRP72 [Bemisia tabaci]